MIIYFQKVVFLSTLLVQTVCPIIFYSNTSYSIKSFLIQSNFSLSCNLMAISEITLVVNYLLPNYNFSLLL